VTVAFACLHFRIYNFCRTHSITTQLTALILFNTTTPITIYIVHEMYLHTASSHLFTSPFFSQFRAATKSHFLQFPISFRRRWIRIQSNFLYPFTHSTPLICMRLKTSVKYLICNRSCDYHIIIISLLSVSFLYVV